MSSTKTKIIDDYRDVLKGTLYYEKYLKIQEEYYKKLGDDYSEVKINISDEISPKAMKNKLISLVNSGMCLDEYIAEKLKEIANQNKESDTYKQSCIVILQQAKVNKNI